VRSHEAGRIDGEADDEWTKTDSTISAASERTGGVGGGNGRPKVTEWSVTLQVVLFGEITVWVGERESRRGGFEEGLG
jgi:hypothetical protein